MSKSLPSRAEVLKLLTTEDRAVHAREIAQRFDVEDARYQGLLRMLDNLAFDGLVHARDGQKFKIVTRGKEGRAREAEEREGVVTVNARGFGFVSSPGATGDDVFVPKEALSGAMHGDRVVVGVRGRNARGAEGEIVRIVSRGTLRASGILRRRGKSAWLEPDDTRVRGPIVLPSGVDAKDDEGNSGKDGDAAIVQITRFPDSPDENPEGRLEAVLGKPGELNVEARKVLAMSQIDEVHTPEAFAEADAFGESVPVEMLEGREDLTGIPLPTIDPEDARDHDDAVWVERTDNGGYRAWIAIADVSSYVRPGTQLDAQAKARGCSIYLPDRAIPMLPRPLSSNLCSLLPNVVRLCLCADVTLDSAGNVVSRRLVRGYMKSGAKLTYGGVARALGLSALPPRDPDAESLREGLRVAHELSRLLRAKRLKRGSLEFDLPEAKILLDDAGQPADVVRRADDPGVKKAYQLIEELMLLANETVAEWLVERDLPGIFRVHESPDETKLDRLVAMCAELGVEFDAEATRDPRALAEVVKTWAEHPLAQVLNMLLLRSMKQAAYDVRNLGHFGLASKAYLHFTSPIRRYPDLVVHRIVHEVLLGERVDRSGQARADLEDSAMAASTAERRAMEVEREIVDLYRAVLMRDKIGERYEGTVTGLVGSGVFVALDAPFVDVLVKLEDLGIGGYELDDEGLKVVGATSGDVVRLGDRMTLTIVDVAILRRSVYGRRLRAEGDDERRHKRLPRRDNQGKKQQKGQAQKGQHKGHKKKGKKRR